MKRFLILGAIVLAVPLISCGPSRPTEATPEPSATSPPTQEPATATPAPTATPIAPVVSTPESVVEFWTTDNETERVQVYRMVAQRFMEANPHIEVRIVPVDESTIAQQLTTVAQNRLPDIARVGIERVAALAAAGYLDGNAAEAVIDTVGRDDFRDGPLAMVTDPETGRAWAVPYDGWLQALWYRRDLFDELGLGAPVTWEELNTACDSLPGAGNLKHGLTLPTDAEQTYTHQVFEQVAMSNNAWPFDAAGNVTFNTLQMIEALDFYAGLKRCAPAGAQNFYSARERYELDDAGMIFYSTYIMDDLFKGSELRGGGKVQIAVEDLPAKTGFASSLVGPNGVASYGQLATLILTRDADPAAQAVATFFLTDGYLDVLALSPLGKVPVLESAALHWTDLSPVFDAYSPATLGHIANSFEAMNRWLFRPEYTAAQRALIGEIEGRLLIPRVIHRIVVEGSMTPEEGAQCLQEQVEMLQIQ